MSEERLKEVNIYSFNDENYVSLQDYTKIQRIIDKAIKYIKSNQSPIAEPSGIMQKTYGKILSEGNIEDLLSILKGEDKECGKHGYIKH